MFSFSETDEKKYIMLSWIPGMSDANVEGMNFNNVEIKIVLYY
jgi:hypothetical protein